jgi:class 3 adenylate cyclase
MHPMKLLGNVGHVESHFSPFGDSVSVGARLVHVCADAPKAQKTFWMQTMELLGDVGHVESCFGAFGDSANLDARQVHG